MKTKVCRACGQEKALDHFTRHAAAPDGFSSRCRACQKAYLKIYEAAKATERFVSEERA